MSNGSEHTPERCVHAVDGPDWAGLREPSSWQELAMAAKARCEKAEAERDALQARLDAMTTDYRLRRVGVVKGKVALVEPFYEQRLVGPWTVVPEGDTNV